MSVRGEERYRGFGGMVPMPLLLEPRAPTGATLRSFADQTTVNQTSTDFASSSISFHSPFALFCACLNAISIAQSAQQIFLSASWVHL